MLFAYSTGLLLSLSLILAIGSQNAFVLRQGILRQRFVLRADILIITGVFGLPLLIADFVDASMVIWWSGSLAFRVWCTAW